MFINRIREIKYGVVAYFNIPKLSIACPVDYTFGIFTLFIQS